MLLPQTGPARLIDEVVCRDERGATCLASVPSGSPFRRGSADAQTVSPCVAIEMGAQAAAFVGSQDDSVQGLGKWASAVYLVGIRETRFHLTALPADEIYRIRATRQQIAPPLRVYSFEVSLGDLIVAEGSVSTYSRD